VCLKRKSIAIHFIQKDPFPDNDIIRLSDLYEKPIELGLQEKAQPMLDLEVKVININEGRNIAIVNHCKKLQEYSVIIARTDSFWKEIGNLEEALKKAIIFCKKHGILKEYLEIHGSEVLNMILTEWNTEDAIAYARNEGHEMGHEEGLSKGSVREKQTIAKNALAEGLSVDIIQKITGLSPTEIIKL
jgi:predicted transposase/invertase (TIGR01784 family)